MQLRSYRANRLRPERWSGCYSCIMKSPRSKPVLNRCWLRGGISLSKPLALVVRELVIDLQAGFLSTLASTAEYDTCTQRARVILMEEPTSIGACTWLTPAAVPICEITRRTARDTCE